MAARLANIAAATSDSGGNIVFAFDAPAPGQVFTGNVFVDQAPSTLASRVTVNGVPWGSATGGQGLQVQALPGEQVKITASGVVGNTSYTAWMIGTVSTAEETAQAGYLYPFPAPPGVSPGGVTPVQPGTLLAVVGYNPTGPTIVTQSTTSAVYVDLDAANLIVTFAVPNPPNILVRLNAEGFPDPGADLFYNLRDATGDVPATDAIVGGSTAGGDRRHLELYLTPTATPALVVGASLTWKWGFRSDLAGTAVHVRYGTAPGPGSPANLTQAGPAVMEVYAAR